MLLASVVCVLLIAPPMLTTDALAGKKAKPPKPEKLRIPKSLKKQGIKIKKVKNPLLMAVGLGNTGPVTVTPTLPSDWGPGSGGVLERGDILVGLENDIFGANPGGAVVRVVLPLALPSKGKPPADADGDGISDNVFPFSDSSKLDSAGRPAVLDPRGLAFPSTGYPTIGNFGDGSGGQAGTLSTGATAVGSNGNFNPRYDSVAIPAGFPSLRPSFSSMLDVPGGGVTALTFGGFAWNSINFRRSSQVVPKPGVKDLSLFMCNADGSISRFKMFSSFTDPILPPGVLFSCDGLSYIAPGRELRNLSKRGPADTVGTFAGNLFVLETANHSIAVIELSISGQRVGRGNTSQTGALVRRISIPGLLLSPTAIATVSESSVPHQGVITTGVDGITQTVACLDLLGTPIPGCDDIQRLLLGNGEPQSIAGLAELGKLLASTPSGDDRTFGKFGFPFQLATGPNGILESVIVPPDGELISLGRGESFGTAIEAGTNGRIETPAQGDDQLFGVTTLLVGTAGGSVFWLDGGGSILGIFQPRVGRVTGISAFDFFDGNGMQVIVATPAYGGAVLRFDLTPADNALSVLSLVENYAAPSPLRTWPGLDSTIQTGDDIPPVIVRPDNSFIIHNPSAGARSEPNNVDLSGDAVPDNVAGSLSVNILDSPSFDGVRGLDRDKNIRDLYSFFTGRLITEIGLRPKSATTIRTGANGLNETPVCTDLADNKIIDCDDVLYLPVGAPRRRGVTVDAGPNGICETLPWENRMGDDQEKLPPDEDFWSPMTVGMYPGDNHVIESPVLGDDVLVNLDVITAGPDGFCSPTVAAGDDVPARLLDLGIPDGTSTTLCVLPGDDEALNTIPGDDDQITNVELVQVGPNGTSDSTRRDNSFIFFGQGQPDATVIAPGRNKSFQSVKGGDDVEFEGVILTGRNGISETVRAGDDVRILPLGQGRAFAPCISAGADGRADTLGQGDDRQLVPWGAFPANSIAIGPGPNGKLETPPRGDDITDRLPVITVKEVALVSTGPLEGISIPSRNTIYMARPGNQSGVIDVTNGEFALALDVAVEILLPTALEIFGPRFDIPTGEIDFFLRQVPVNGKLNVATGQAVAYSELGPALPFLAQLYDDPALGVLDGARIVTSVFGRAAVVAPSR